MDDLISRQAAIDVLEKGLSKIPYMNNTDEDMIRRDERIGCIQEVRTLPSAQTDIIACGDCKHWICHDKRCGYWNHGVKPLDWCCHAERRTDDQTE